MGKSPEIQYFSGYFYKRKIIPKTATYKNYCTTIKFALNQGEKEMMIAGC